MLNVTLKGLWAHKLRYALTGVAVVLGVAFVVGATVLTDTMERTLERAVASANDGIDVIVRRDAPVEGELATARARVEAATVDRVAAVPGVDVARGSVQSPVQLVRSDGTASPADGTGAAVGANWIDDARLNPFALSSGRAPGAAGEAVVDRTTADAEGWAPGDRIRVLTKAGPTELTVVGTATYGTADGLPGTSLVAVDDATAQRLFAEPGRYDRVLAAAAPGVAPADLAGRVEASVGAAGSGLEVLTGEQDTAAEQARLQDQLGAFGRFLEAFAYVALFVGMFIVYNTFSIVVGQRARELAMLRAIGARRGQVLRAVVLEALVVGLVASAAGLAAGIGLSYGLRALLDAGGLDIPAGALVVSSGAVITALLVGTGVSVLSALVPALRAGRVRPIAALRTTAVDRSGTSFGRAATGLVVTGAGAASFAAGLSASGDGLPLVGLGAVAAVLGLFVLGPVLVRPVVAVLGAPTRLFGVTGRYARGNAVRNPGRTATTASALMIGVALVGFITIFASSTKASISAAVRESFRADYVVESGSPAQGFAVSVEDALRARPEVARLSPVRTTVAEVDGSPTDVMAVDTAVIDGLYDLRVDRGSIDAVGTGAVAVAVDVAADGGLGLGDTVPFRFAGGGAVPLTVRAVFDANAVGGEADWIVGLDTYEAHVADQFDRRVFVAVDPAVPASESRSALEAALAAWPNAEVQDQAAFREQIAGQIDKMLNLVYGLLALAVVIALLGIANTLALSVHERTREIGLLRAIGMHRRQVRRAVRFESLLIAVLGAGLGALLAVGSAWGLVRALHDEGVTMFTVPAAQLALILGMAGLAGVAAAAGPARRAARLDVLDAISAE